MISADAEMDWERMAALRPRLGVNTQVHRHCYRGVVCYVVRDGATARHVRLAQGAWRIVGLMDGERTLQQIHDALLMQLGEQAPGAAQLVQVLNDLYSMELLDCDGLVDVDVSAARQRQQRRQRQRRWLSSPLAQKIPLCDPQPYLDRWYAPLQGLFSQAGLLVWLLVLLGTCAVAIGHSDSIAADLSRDVLGGSNLLLLIVAYLLVKLLHELGHALATRAFGGEVHEMGVMLLVLVPVPYVDASAASAFASKSQRMAVGAVGIMVEMLLAALALLLWLAVEPGTVRDFAYSVFLVGGVSTLLFNGNPLLRFDGYYVLCDGLEIPNLGTRSKRYLGYLIRRYLCAEQQAVSPVSAPGERAWFVFYGIASSIYRIAILLAIVVFVAQTYWFVGVVLGLWVCIMQILLPAAKALAALHGSLLRSGRGLRGAILPALVLSALLAGTFVAPLPTWTYAEGVVWLPEHAQVRAGTSGFIRNQLVTADSEVEQGQQLFVLDGRELDTELEVAEQQLQALQVRYDSALFRDRASLQVLRQQLARAQSTLADIQQRHTHLRVRSPLGGTLMIPDQNALQGRYVRKGEVLGFVTDPRPLTARVVIRQSEIDRVRERTDAVRVKLPGHLRHAFTGTLATAVPSAITQLPNAALGARGGGRIAVQGKDPQGLQPAESVFLVDVVLPRQVPSVAAGTRVYLRFEHPSSPLALQLARALRQLLLTHFAV